MAMLLSVFVLSTGLDDQAASMQHAELARERLAWEKSHAGSLPWELALPDELWDCVTWGWSLGGGRFCFASEPGANSSFAACR